jgi:amino acid transporter
VIIQYWPGSQDINPAVWISILIFVVTVLNLCAVSFYGEAEFVFASIKVITIVGLLILALVIDLGGGPNHDRLGFRYWKDPGVMKEYIGHGATGRFLGFFSSIVNACFSFGGTEFLAVSAGEAENPRKTIPRAVRRVFYRIFLFYVLGSLAVGVLVPYNDSNLLSAQQSNASGAASSPWVVAITRAGIPALPSIINAVILTSASSAANAMVYSGSRYVYGMARNGQAPKLFLKCTESYVFPKYPTKMTFSHGFVLISEALPMLPYFWRPAYLSSPTCLSVAVATPSSHGSKT